MTQFLVGSIAACALAGAVLVSAQTPKPAPCTPACVIGLAPIFVRLSGAGPAATGFWRLLFSLPVLALLSRQAGSGLATPSRVAIGPVSARSASAVDRAEKRSLIALSASACSGEKPLRIAPSTNQRATSSSGVSASRCLRT